MTTPNRAGVPLVCTLALILGLAGLSATDASPPASGQPQAEDAIVEIPTRTIEVTDGAEFDQRLIREGYSQDEIRALTLAARDRAIRAAYTEGDLRAIRDIESQLTPGEIKNALAGSDAIDGSLMANNSGQHLIWTTHCGYGFGVIATFRVFGGWASYFETVNGTRTSIYRGYCSNWTHGCNNSDHVQAHPSVSWRFHWLSAWQWNWHQAACTLS